MRDCIDKMANFIKKVVSKEKRRYEEDGYNLDLTYITGRIIAMGFPAQHIEAIYRNSLEDVKKMLEQKHRDHYKLYNLCSERSYDVAKFQNRVAYYPFDDHNPPEFSMMKTFCEDVEKWLAKNEENIAVVHCKAGKGRTGLMICAYLLHCKHNKMTNSEEVLRFYASKRTHNDQGVTIPSQRRYVDYYAAMLQDRLQYSPVKLYLHSFVIDPVPNLGLNQADSFIQFEVRQKHIRLYESQVYQVKKTDSPITIKLPEALLLIDDVRIDINQYLDFFGKKILKSKFHFWVNTFFIDQERNTDLCHEIQKPSAEQTFYLVSMVPTILNRSSCLTHEGLTSRPSLPVTAPHVNNTTTAVAGGEMLASSGVSPQSLMSVSSTGTVSNSGSTEHQDAHHHHPSAQDSTTTVAPSHHYPSAQDSTTTVAPSHHYPSAQDSTTTVAPSHHYSSTHESTTTIAPSHHYPSAQESTTTIAPSHHYPSAQESTTSIAAARISRSAHNSGETVVVGGGGGPGSDPIPLPGQLRQNRSEPSPVTVSDDRLDTKSPNGSFVPNLISIPKHQKSVVLVDNRHQLDGTNCDIVKSKYLSDDTLTDQHPNATPSAFNDRKRHRSVPMMAKTDFGDGAGGMRRNPGVNPNSRMNIQGKMMSVRLRKHQIDKADRDQGSKRFSDNFNVTLFLIRPSNQTLQDEFLRPNCIAQHMDHCPGGYCTACTNTPNQQHHPPLHPAQYSPDSTSEDDSDDDDLYPEGHNPAPPSCSTADQTTWANDAVFLPPTTASSLSSTVTNVHHLPPASKVEVKSSVKWRLGNDCSGTPVSSSTTSSSVIMSPGCPGGEDHQGHHHPHHPQQHNHPIHHSYSSTATVSVAAEPVVRRNASAASDQQTSGAGDTATGMHGLVRNPTDSLAELCRRSTQTTWI